MIFFLPLAVFGLEFCRIDVENQSTLQKGFVDSYLSQKLFETFIETGWVQNCDRGKPIKVVVNDISFEGRTISNNRFSGYTFRISFTIMLPERELHYSLSRYVALPDPSMGTLPIRSALVDLLESYQIRIKKDLLNYERELGASQPR